MMVQQHPPHPHSMSHSLQIDTADSSLANNTNSTAANKSKSKKRKFLRRMTHSETWSSKTAVSSGGEAESVSNTPNCAYHPVKESTEDNSVPSSSSFRDLQRVIHLIESERHLVAFDLYTDVKRRLDDWSVKQNTNAVDEPRGSERSQKSASRWKKMGWRGARQECDVNEGRVDESSTDFAENQEAYNFYTSRLEEFEALEKRATMFHTAQQNLNTPTSWTLSQTLFGITTHYRREDDNTLSVKIEGELHGIPLFEQMVVLRECDLYHLWAPFCNESRKLAQLDKMDVVAWYTVGSPLLGLVRDACYRAVGCDCMREDGSVLLVAVGLGDEMSDVKNDNDVMDEAMQRGETRQQVRLENPLQQENQTDKPLFTESSASLLNTNATSFLARDEILSTIAIPPIPTGMGHGRMTINNFSASITVLGASSARTRMVVNINPNLHFLPQSLIDFVMKRMCGVLLGRLQAAARKVLKDPVKNPHARRMREDVRFYRDWLLPKFRVYCDELGWVMPPVKAFDVSEDDLKAEEIFEGWRSEEMLDSSTVNSPRNDQSEICSEMQQYQIEDIASNPGNVISHRRTHSDISNAVTPRVRKRDRLKQLMQGGSSTGLDSDDCTLTSESSKRLRKRDKFKQLFQEKESKEDKIAAAREKAQARLRPEPFSQSRMLRLKELKDAKARTEERLLRMSRGGESQSESEVGSIRSEFRSESVTGFNDVDENRSARQNLTIFIICLCLDLVLLPFKGYATASVEVPSNFKMTSSDWADLLPRNLLAILIIFLHTTSLWATLNTFLVIAFDTMDFGQKHLAKNLEYGRKLYVDAVKKYSMLICIATAFVSLGVGLISAIFQNIIFKMCSWLDKDSPSITSLVTNSMSQLLPEKYVWILDDISRLVLLAKDSVMIVLSWVHTVAYQLCIPSVYKYVCIIMSWIAAKLSSIIPSLLKKIGSGVSVFIFKSISSTISSHLSICTDRSASVLSWRYEAIQISSFITTRLAAFVLSLLFMSYLLLPKPEKKLSKTKHVRECAPIRQVEVKHRIKPADACDGDVLSEVSGNGPSQKKHHSLRSSGSIPMEVIKE